MQHYQLDIAMPVSLEQSFTYLASENIPSGCRVAVPFGRTNKRTTGVVLGPSRQPIASGVTVKAILARIDDVPVYSPLLLDLARWMSTYYMHPLGEVLRTMLPASQKAKASQVSLTESGKLIWKDHEHSLGPLFRFIWKKASGRVSHAVFLKRMKEAAAEGLTRTTLAKMRKEGWVLKEEKRASRETGPALESLDQPASAGQPAPPLTKRQSQVLGELLAIAAQPQPKPCLLHGVTGAGKTEVYLHLIADLLGRDPQSQVLVLVPEIALTPQMTRVFTARFPGLVSVVHSAMADADRWTQMEAIRGGQRKILIGPRSAVFAAFERLKLLIVDEEHDSSYKQTTGLTYNGRDVAVMRGFLEKALVVLGSATPSLESYANAQQGKYQLLELPERVHGRGLPDVQLVRSEIDQAFARRLSPRGQIPRLMELPIDPSIILALRENHAQGMQAMVIVNRRGFAYFLFSLKDRKTVSCPQCSISMTVHKNSTILRCHYCDFSQRIDDVVLPEERDAYVMVGYGSEQMELYLREALPGARIQRVDSDTTSNRETLPTILNDFREGRIDVLVGTQMLAKGHDFARVTLICILEVDQVLNLPDFRAGERAFQLMVQASGRAGRGEHSGRVLIQTQKPEHPILQAGVAQDFQAFWQDQELFRRQHGYPPFGRMILFEYSGTRKDQLDELMRAIDRWVSAGFKKSPEVKQSLQLLGPAIPPIEMIRGRLRRTLLLVSTERKILAWFAQQLRSAFADLKGDLRLRIDVDPQSLM